jgi:hypothetical protein
MFSVGGGASSCVWEMFTYHRTSPTLTVDYLGADHIPETMPALFKATLGQEQYYYEAGPSEGKERPGWMSMDVGYDRPSMALYVIADSVKNGLRMSVNGYSVGFRNVEFHNFGIGHIEVLVEVVRGPLEHLYAAPIIAFGDVCPGTVVTAHGERAADTTVGMVGDPANRAIEWIQPCPSVSWSGDILSDGTFFVSTSQTTMSFSVLDPTRGLWETSLYQNLQFQYRFRGALDWKTEFEVAGVEYVDGQHSVFSAEWTPEAGLMEGEYEIRVVALCSMIADTPEEYAEASTTIIRGMMDRTDPEVVTASSSVTAITVVFTEPIVCLGLNPVDRTEIKPVFGIRIGESDTITGDTNLRVRCDGDYAEVILSLTAAGVTKVAASTGTITITFEDVYDRAGNKLSVEEFEVGDATVGDDDDANLIGGVLSAQAGSPGADEEETGMSADKVKTDYVVVVGVLTFLLALVVFDNVRMRYKGAPSSVVSSDKLVINDQAAANAEFEGFASTIAATAAAPHFYPPNAENVNE